eukprot:471697-Pleurochrysis_carterae.AAC.1
MKLPLTPPPPPLPPAACVNGIVAVGAAEVLGTANRLPGTSERLRECHRAGAGARGVPYAAAITPHTTTERTLDFGLWSLTGLGCSHFRLVLLGFYLLAVVLYYCCAHSTAKAIQSAEQVVVHLQLGSTTTVILLHLQRCRVVHLHINANICRRPSSCFYTRIAVGCDCSAHDCSCCFVSTVAAHPGTPCRPEHLPTVL